MSASPHRFPLSPVQYGMLVESMRAPGRGVYALQILLRFRHPLEPDVLERALRAVIRHHPSLRTGFGFASEDGPAQVVHPDAPLALEPLDLSQLDRAAQERAREDHLAAERARGFDLRSDEPPMRAALARYADDDWELLWTTHHAQLDGRSWVIVVTQLFEAYDALLAGDAPQLPAARPYSDYVDWRETRDVAAEEAFWRAYLDGAELPTRLPFDACAEADGEPFGSVEVELDEEASRAIAELAERAGVSVHNYVQAAWTVVLHQASGGEDVVFGTTRACRSFAPDAREMVGMFLNTVPLRTRVTPETKVAELLTSLRAGARALRDFEHSSAGEIRRWATVPPGVPLFESVVVFENFDYVPFFHARGGEWARRDPRFAGPTPFPITLSGYRADRIPLRLSYDAHLYARATIERVTEHLVALLAAMAAAPEAAVAALPALGDGGAAARRESDFWARRLALLDARALGSEPAGARAEVLVPFPARLEAVDEREEWSAVALIAFLARIVGDDGHVVAVRADAGPFAELRLPSCGSPFTLESLRADLTRALEAGERATAGAVAIEIVDELGAAPAADSAVLLLQVPRRGAAWRCVADRARLGGGAVTALRAHAAAFAAALATSGDEGDLRTVDLRTPDERRRAARWNDTRAERPRACVHDLIGATAARQPDATAVEDGSGSMTYAELDDRLRALARWLRARGVGRGDLVGVHLDRSVDLPVALLGVLRSGASFVPLDPIYPERRIAQIVEDSGLALIVTDARYERGLAHAGVEVVALDRAWPEIAAAGAAPVGPVTPDDVAYVIYTSGSTGRPKGVRVRHGGLTNFLLAMAERPGLRAGESLLAVTTVCFDIAYLELFLPLVVGGRVRLCASDVAADGFALRELVETARPSAMQATPATWKLLVAAGWEGDPRLRALCGGEALPRELADALLARAGELWNLYGPTETTIWSAAERVAPGGPVLIGRPIANTSFHVLDPRGQPCPPGIPGELYIGGDGVAAGYHARPDLTRERFVPDPVEPDARAYRTGDVVRQRGDGRLEYLGREDDQVKVNGFRIELGEVEAALRELPQVADAVVAAGDGPGGTRRLAAYLVLADGATLAADAARRHLSDRLPDYMVPSVFARLPGLPLTPNGKVDRGALPDPQAAATLSDGPHVRPRSALERRIAAVWRSVLDREDVGATESFFDLGGDSLLLMQLVDGLRAELDRSITHLDVFEFPTIRALAGHLGEPAADGDAAAPARPAPRSPAARSAQLAGLSARRRRARAGRELTR